MTWSCVPGIFPKSLFPRPVFSICMYLSKLIFSSPKTKTISSNTLTIIFQLVSYSEAISVLPTSISSSSFSLRRLSISFSTKKLYSLVVISLAEFVPRRPSLNLINGSTTICLISLNLAICSLFLSVSSWKSHSLLYHLLYLMSHFKQ